MLEYNFAHCHLYLFFFSFILEICDTDLSRKISLCNELLEIAEGIEPGASLFRARILLDLQDAQTHQTSRQFADKAISAVVAHVNITYTVFFNHIQLEFVICLQSDSFLSLFFCQEQFNEQLDVLTEADNIFGTDAIMQPIVKARIKQINANIQKLKLPR